jgi:hypothetical protein
VKNVKLKIGEITGVTIMALKKFTVSLSNEDKNLSLLQCKEYNSNFNQFKFFELPKKNLAKSLKMLEFCLKGDYPSDEDTILAVKAENGIFKKFYGPMVLKKDNQLGVQIFDRFYELNLEEGYMVGDHIPDNVEVSVEFEKVTFNDFENVVVKFSIFNEDADTLVSIYVPVKWVDFKDQPEVELVQRFLKKNSSKLLEYVGEKGNGGDNLPALKLKQLEIGDKFLVSDYQHIKFQNREAFLLTIIPDDTSGYYYPNVDSDETEPLPQKFKVWSNSELVRYLSSNPVIDENNPATLLIRDKKKTAKGVSVSTPLIVSESSFTDDEEELDFNF